MLLLPIVIILGAVLAGLLAERIAAWIIRRIAKRSGWRGAEHVLGALRGMLAASATIAGALYTLDDLSLPYRTEEIARQILMVMIVAILAIVIARLLAALLRFYVARQGAAVPGVSILTTITAVTVYCVATLIVLRLFGVSVAPILTALGVGGLAVALALQDTLSNLFAGFHIMMSGQIRPGDFIKLSTGEEGNVTDITWRSTMIRSVPDITVIIPNSKLASATVTNTYLPGTPMNISIDVGVRYGSDLREVERIAVEVARDTVRDVTGAVKTSEPVIRFHTFGDTGVRFSTIVRIDEYRDQFLVKHEYLKRLDTRFREAGIEMPVTRMTVSPASDAQPQ